MYHTLMTSTSHTVPHLHLLSGSSGMPDYTPLGLTKGGSGRNPARRTVLCVRFGACSFVSASGRAWRCAPVSGSLIYLSRSIYINRALDSNNASFTSSMRSIGGWSSMAGGNSVGTLELCRVVRRRGVCFWAIDLLPLIYFQNSPE